MGDPGERDEDPPPPKPQPSPSAPRAPDGPPLRPESPFVSRLRMEVAAHRSPSCRGQQWELQPSIGSWLTPRGRRREAGEGGASGSGSSTQVVRRVSFAAEGEETSPPVTCEKLELRVKGSVAKPFSLEDVDAGITIAQLKELCQPHVNLLPEQQRLLHKGKLLQDQQTLEEAKIPNKGTVFLVKAQAKKVEEEPQPQKAAPPASQGPTGPPCIECGVNVGRPQTNGLCSICWREQVVRENKEMKRRRDQAKRREEEAVKEAEERRRQEEELELRRQQDTSRCYTCRKKIGLTGFVCQCGYHFCATHRYAEEHGCTFDHRARGRDILAQQAGATRGSPSSEAR
mmetsp:Transcript_71581/g.207262  ORF Transcript_71581/g.207262 Transcript_71581/m.207262 type:complete len:343 (-) Transcript_71581:182-1210(-)